MIRDHMKIWLLHPDFKLASFGKLPEWLDETDERPAVEQLGARWQPLEAPREMVSVTVWVKVEKPERDKDGKAKPASDNPHLPGAAPRRAKSPAVRRNPPAPRTRHAVRGRHRQHPQSAKFGRVALMAGEPT